MKIQNSDTSRLFPEFSCLRLERVSISFLASYYLSDKDTQAWPKLGLCALERYLGRYPQGQPKRENPSVGLRNNTI